MNSLPPPKRPDPPAVLTPGSGALSELEKVLGERTKLKAIQQKTNASYPPTQAPRKKAFSSKPTTIDI